VTIGRNRRNARRLYEQDRQRLLDVRQRLMDMTIPEQAPGSPVSGSPSELTLEALRMAMIDAISRISQAQSLVRP
jgi:hypothetical protein